MSFYTYIKNTNASKNVYSMYIYLCIASVVFILSACSDASSTSTSEAEPVEIEALYKTPYTNENAQQVLHMSDLTYDYLFSVYGLNIDTVTAARITIDTTAYDWNTDSALSKITLSSFQTNNVHVLGVGLVDDAGVDYNALPDTITIAVRVNTDTTDTTDTTDATDATDAVKLYTKEMTVSKATDVTENAVQYTPIYTWWNLQSIQNDLSGNYILQNDIRFPEPGTYGFPPYGFIPLGHDTTDENTENVYFTGNFVGKNHAIENLFIDTNHEDWPTDVSKAYVGLFGTVGQNFSGGIYGGGNSKAGHVKHVMLKSPNITASRTAGGIAGQIEDGSVIAGVVGGSITGGLNVGGLVGRSHLDPIIGYSTSTVTLSIPADLRNVTDAGSYFAFQVGGLAAEGSYIMGYATGDVSIIDPHSDGEQLENSLTANGITTGNDCGTTLVGYAVNKVSGIEDAPKNAVSGFSNAIGATPDNTSGYWDMSITPTNTIESITGISATKNIVFDSDNGYTDSKGTADTTDDTTLFTATVFADAFDTTNGTSKTFPKLKSPLTYEGESYDFTLPQPTVSDINGDGVIEVTFAETGN